jgi:site-specific DNA-methyltransferase (adenine-specific)
MNDPRCEVLSDTVTIWLGDCRDVLPLIGCVDTVVTDPPYGMSFVSNHRSTKHVEIRGDGDSSALNLATNLTPSHSSYVFGRWDEIACVPKPDSIITWVKNNWSMGDLNHAHARQTEVIFFYAGNAHFFPHKRPSDVIDLRRVSTDDHPTAKSPALMETIIRWTDGVVLDPFMGTGPTGVASVILGRPFIGIEIEPKYFDIACRRISEALAKPRLPFIDPPQVKQEAFL